jgi:hypothetical protein
MIHRQLTQVMEQLGCERVADLPGHLARGWGRSAVPTATVGRHPDGDGRLTRRPVVANVPPGGISSRPTTVFTSSLFVDAFAHVLLS